MISHVGINVRKWKLAFGIKGISQMSTAVKYPHAKNSFSVKNERYAAVVLFFGKFD